MAVAEGKKRLMLTVSEEVAQKFEELAKEKGLSKSALLTVWVNQEQTK